MCHALNTVLWNKTNNINNINNILIYPIYQKYDKKSVPNRHVWFNLKKRKTEFKFKSSYI